MLTLVREVRVSFGERSVSASVHGEGPTSVVLGPGAGGTRLTPLLLRVAEAVAASGRSAVLYNFPYSEAGRRAPDPPELLESTARAMADFARGELLARRLVLGGKSMGGRIASQAVAKGTSADGLLFLGYPLHPPGKPEQRREAHLPALTTPMLFVQGTRDAFARFDLLEALLQRLGDRARLFRVEGGDHSFAVPRSSGRARSEVEEDIARAVLRWLEEQRL
jgi:predicted alpha/beta-hydrolase family hydrolase